MILEDVAELEINPQPNGLTYLLEKVRLAQVCRSMADNIPMDTSEFLHVPHEQIIATDDALEKFILNLPYFFRVDTESRERTRPLETVYPCIPILRYHITTAAYFRRCKLHQRVLLRKAISQPYAYSRSACLISARTIIQGYEILREYYSISALRAHLGICVRYTYLALAVLIMDLCFNKDETNQIGIKTSVKAALQTFEDAKDESPLPGQFLGSLRDILQNHKVDLTNLSTTERNHNNASTPATEPSVFKSSDNEMQSMQLGLDIFDSGMDFDTSFDDFWQMAVQSEPNLDCDTWANLFSNLDSGRL
jgi:hypothetical protein